MISKVKPLHKKVEETSQAIDDADRKMNTLDTKRKVERLQKKFFFLFFFFF